VDNKERKGMPVMKPTTPNQNSPNQPDKEFFQKNPRLAQEWKRVCDRLSQAQLVRSTEYPEIDSVRWNASAPLNTLIDHTLLKQSAGAQEYLLLCDQAKQWGTKSVCVPPNRAPLAKEALMDSSVLVCSVVGFPFGYDSTKAKVEETQWLIHQGVDEIDMVVPVGWIKDGEFELVYQDIHSVVSAAQGRLVKVILETSELTDLEKVAGSTIACFAGAHFLKTSTGFASGGADLESLAIMRAVAGPLRGIKASGGVRTRDFALQCISLGIDRIGTSSAAAILGISDQKGSDY
jgi:deoxyribose-phosphate aldolase